MSKLVVLLDSSTKPSAPSSKYGESCYAWLAIWSKSRIVAKASLTYLNNEGPNKTFYGGILDILRSCWYLCHPGDELKIWGDCELVVNHVNSNKPKIDGELMPFYKQAKKLILGYRCPVLIRYVSRNNIYYKTIDNISKTGKDWLKEQTKKIFKKEGR